MFTRVEAICIASFLLAGCAFTDYGSRINDERQTLESLERKRDDYEARYVLVLNSLEKYVGDPKLEQERGMLQKKILEINVKVEQQRKNFEQSVEEWNQKISQDKLQKEMLDREEQIHVNQPDGEWTK